MKPTLLITLLVLLAATGCSSNQELNHAYGRRSGDGAHSINGTSALADMFQQAGHRVRSWRYLSPSLEDADVIVWFPSDTVLSQRVARGLGVNLEPGNLIGDRSVPSEEAVDWLDDWLAFSENERTLIVVGGDWTADTEYWTAMGPKAAPGQSQEYKTRLSKAKARRPNPVKPLPDPKGCDWFAAQAGNAPTIVKQLRGPLGKGIDPAKADLEHWSTLRPGAGFDTLLADGQAHPLVSEYVYDAGQVDWTDQDSRLIVVENGGFLVNGALVNHERRKLAGRLINHLGPERKRVVFLEADAEPLIRESDPNPRPPTGLELFAIWPIGAILAQVAALFLVYALARWPVFGVARRLRPPELTDFARHIDALGRLLQATGDRAYAVSQLRAYFHLPAKAGPFDTPAEPGHASSAVPSESNPKTTQPNPGKP